MRRDFIPSDVNIHRQRHKRSSFGGATGTRKQVNIIHDVLQRSKKPVQPEMGWNYNKKERRLLQGFRHRKLSDAWHYFGGLKDMLPRNIKPNSHVPDAIFMVANLLILLSTGMQFGVKYASDGFVRTLEDTYEYKLFRENKPNLEHQGHKFWMSTAPFDWYANWYFAITLGFCLSCLIGFVGIYVADQKIHLAYVIGMLISLFATGIVAVAVASREYCPDVKVVMEEILKLLLDNYYEKLEVKHPNGTFLLDPNGNKVEVRTYKAANLMDRIQLGLHCCGINSIEDYTNARMDVPASCCTPLWNLNPHCSNTIPKDVVEYRAKLQIYNGTNLGCLELLDTVCVNLNRMMGISSQYLCSAQWILFFVALVPLLLQARQIRQLRRWPHLRISAGSISQSLQASAGNEGAKSGGGGVRAVVEASKFTEKQQERLQQTRREALFKNIVEDEESSESTDDDADSERPVLVNIQQIKNLEHFIDNEDKTQLEMPELDRTVEGFAGRFNILANKNLQNYVSGIFSTTYQNGWL